MKILLQHKSLIIGGIERALLSFIENMKINNKIDLVLFNNAGGLAGALPRCIKVIEINKYFRMSSGVHVEKKEKSKSFFWIKRMVFSLAKFFGVRKILKFFALKKQNKLNDIYDVSIAFHGLDDLGLKFVLYKTNASKKLAFIHCDVSQVIIPNKTLKLLKMFDKIICVSRSCAKIFLEKYPNFNSKVDYLYNFQDINVIEAKSNAFKPTFRKGFNIVTVARLSPEKGMLRTLKVLKELKQEGYDFFYNIIGEGFCRYDIEDFINKNRMKEYVFLYGNQENPYPFIKHADLVYVGSFHESFGIVLIESMILKTPIMSTKTCSSSEIIGNKGIVCDNFEENIKKSIKSILVNKECLKKYKEKLKTYSFSNEKIKEKFVKLCK